MRRFGRLRLDLLSELVDHHAEVIDLLAVVGSPHGLQNLPMCQDLVRMGYEMPQQVVLFRREARDVSSSMDLPSVEVDLDAGQRKTTCCGALQRGHSAKRRAGSEPAVPAD